VVYNEISDHRMEQNVEQQGNKERQVNRKSNLVYGRIKRRIGQVKYETIL